MTNFIILETRTGPVAVNVHHISEIVRLAEPQRVYPCPDPELVEKGVEVYVGDRVYRVDTPFMEFMSYLANLGQPTQLFPPGHIETYGPNAAERHLNRENLEDFENLTNQEVGTVIGEKPDFSQV